MAPDSPSLHDIPVKEASPRSAAAERESHVEIDRLFAETLQRAAEFNRHIDKPTLRRAFRFAAERHRGHFRRSGDPFILHSLEVMRALTDMRLDTQTLAAGLLHDVVEDTDTPIAEIEVQFGEDVALIVDGVTKISGFKLRGREERQVDTFRKMLLSIAKDVRVIIVKFADRLHNMRTLDYLDPDQQQRIARETLDVYAPLAHRFGMARIRRELEDLAFSYVAPEAHHDIAGRVDGLRDELSAHIDELQAGIATELRTRDIDAEVQGRIKHLYSIHRKMTTQNKDFDDIYDLLAMRVVVDSVDDCYHVMAILHQAYRPLHGRFKDYVANAKHNGYQSLHTTIYSHRDRIVEVQIRTGKMHQVAEEGIARHWLYKEGRVTHDIDQQTRWVKQFLEWADEIQDPREFVEQLKIDLFPDEVFVQTPKGDVIGLPKGGTALDFAFAVHTEVGLHATTAVVNGRIAQLGYELHSSDTVKITTAPAQKPKRDWLSMVRTSKARSRIRRFLREQSYAFDIEIGTSLLDRRFRKARIQLTDDDWAAAALAFDVVDREHLLAAVGGGDISVDRVMDHLRPQAQEQPRKSGAEDEAEVTVLHLDDPMLRYAQCCNPVPGDPVFGFITRGRGLSVHHRDCPNAPGLHAEPDRIIPVAWDTPEEEQAGGPFKAAIIAKSSDRVGVLSQVTATISDAGANIRHADARTQGEDGHMSFVIEVRDLKQLRRVISKVRLVGGVTEVHRIASTEDEDELRALIDGKPFHMDEEE